MNDLGWAPPVKFHRKQAFEIVPTWQQGIAQPTDADLANFASSGYAANSLIYACIRELATSAAGVPIELLRPDKEGWQPEPQHAVLDLLDEPNDDMDFSSFIETLVTHRAFAGNAYIEKVRAGGRVARLGFLRPDRVEIKPGAKREDDIFVYTIGTTKRYIERKDVIHFKLPNPKNDFYGLSPIEVIAREGDLDQRMTDFASAFFKNAGVPFGLLTVPGATTEEEKKQIRSRWRRAFQGIKKWFQLLILNQESAKYQALGLSQKDMEFESTRKQVESRICAAFGVPPILVGALVGLEHATYANYGVAQQSFWSETMKPLLYRIASRLTRDLLPEFATTADRRARLAFDTSGVAALQQDNTGKLEVVAKLIAGGGFTPNQALEIVGIPAVEGADFYVRSLTQLIERPAMKSRVGFSLPEGKATAQAQRFVEALLTIRQRTEIPFAHDLEEYFEAWARRIVSALEMDSRAPIDQLLPASADAELATIYAAHIEAMSRATWQIIDEMLPKGRKEGYEDRLLTPLLARVGGRVSGIHEVTRQALRGTIQRANEEGYSAYQMINGVEADNFPGVRSIVTETYANRAQAIARTELATFQNWAANRRYAEAGVTQVEIVDGDGCGWTSHNDPDIADGSRRTIEEADDYPLAHPNCCRVTIPVVE